MKETVCYQEIDIPTGNLPLALLRQAVAETAPHGVGRKLRDIGLVRDGQRVVIKLYYGGPEKKKSKLII